MKIYFFSACTSASTTTSTSTTSTSTTSTSTSSTSTSSTSTTTTTSTTTSLIHHYLRILLFFFNNFYYHLLRVPNTPLPPHLDFFFFLIIFIFNKISFTSITNLLTYHYLRVFIFLIIFNNFIFNKNITKYSWLIINLIFK